MATLIPTLAQCAARMTLGERRTAKRLLEVLGPSAVVWYGVAIGASTAQPDFIVFDPALGVVVLEVKDWKGKNIHAIRKDTVELLVEGDVKVVPNPLAQVRGYAERIASLLEREKSLTHEAGPRRGKLIVPWGYAAILANVARAAFDRDCEERGVGNVLPPRHVLCRDELSEEGDPEEFCRRLWSVLPWTQPRRLTSRESDAVRWHLFPEIRVTAAQLPLFADEEKPAPIDLLRVMDLQQEQVARGLGAGHRVIHGVAGSGKTMVLRYRAIWLAKALPDQQRRIAADRHASGPLRSVVMARDRRTEVDYVAGRFRELHTTGHRWSEMAVLQRRTESCASFAAALRKAGLPVATKKEYRPGNEEIVVLTYHSSKGLEFPIVAIPGLPMAEQPMAPPQDEIRLLYVAMTRAMEHLVLTSQGRPSAAGDKREVQSQ